MLVIFTKLGIEYFMLKLNQQSQSPQSPQPLQPLQVVHFNRQMKKSLIPVQHPDMQSSHVSAQPQHFEHPRMSSLMPHVLTLSTISLVLLIASMGMLTRSSIVRSLKSRSRRHHDLSLWARRRSSSVSPADYVSRRV